MRVDLLVTDRPITPSGTGRAAPHLCWSGAPTDGPQMQSCIYLISSQVEDPGAPEITKDQPSRRWTLTGAQLHHWWYGIE